MNVIEEKKELLIVLKNRFLTLTLTTTTTQVLILLLHLM